MKLIDLLVKELPKRGGWPLSAIHSWCDRDGEIRFRGDGCQTDFYPSISVDHSDRIPEIKFEDSIEYIVTRQQYEAALSASQNVEWDGIGLPPVGCECEVSVDGGRTWCTYKAISEVSGTRLIEIGNFTEDFQSNNWDFRPLRTEADKKREESSNFIARFLGEPDLEKANLLYDAIAAGKIPGVKLED